MCREEAIAQIHNTFKPIIATTRYLSVGDIVQPLVVNGYVVDLPFTVIRETTIAEWAEQIEFAKRESCIRIVNSNVAKGFRQVRFFELAIK